MTRTTSLFLAAAAAMLGTSALPAGDRANPHQVQISNQAAQGPSHLGLIPGAPTRTAAAARALAGAWRGWRGWRYPKPGHSVRQGQRMARKRRNQVANRRAQRP